MGRLLEKGAAEFVDYRRDVGPVLGHLASAKLRPHCVGQECRRSRRVGEAAQKIRDRIDQRVTDGAEFLW